MEQLYQIIVKPHDAPEIMITVHPTIYCGTWRDDATEDEITVFLPVVEEYRSVSSDD
jgi:hypothetical protein